MVGKESQSGIAPIPLLLIGGFVVIVLGVIIYSLSSGTKAPSNPNQTTPSASASTTTTSNTSPKPGNEFDVSDLGFKLTLPSGLTGMTQIVQQNQTASSIGLDSYSFSSVTLSNSTLTADDPANCSAASAGLGTINKYAFNPVGVDQLATDANTIQLGSFWLSYQAPMESCSQNATASSYQSSQIPLVEQAYETAATLN